MRIKIGVLEQIFNVCNKCIMFVYMLITLYPLLYVAFASVSRPELMVQHRGLLLGLWALPRVRTQWCLEIQ